MNNTFFQLLSLIKNGQNPQQLAMFMLQSRAKNNPMLMNLLQLAQNNDTAGIEKVVRNVAAQQGVDYDREFESFRKNLGY